MRQLAVVVLVTLAAAPAWAQSKRYPPDAIDRDAEADAKSRLWDNAIDPNQVPYQNIVNEALERMKTNTSDAWREAIARLDDAIKLMPKAAEAYRVRGEAYWNLQEWARCADDFDRAWQRSRKDLDAKSTGELRRKLGVCQARAGKLADAERTLAETAATGASSGELWMRLAEVRIAMGKLEEAIAALESARDAGDQESKHALIKWMLVGAYDRARKPSEVAAAAKEAINADRNLRELRSPTLPLLGNGEADYLLALANMAFEPSRREIAVVHLRRFLQIAVDSPWRRRAEEHLRELRTTQFPEIDGITPGGTAVLDRAVARDLVRKGMPAMRACMAKLPLAVFEVTITKVGPKPQREMRFRREVRWTEGVMVKQADETLGGGNLADVDAAETCIEAQAKKLRMPAVREADTHYVATFRVVAP